MAHGVARRKNTVCMGRTALSGGGRCPFHVSQVTPIQGSMAHLVGDVCASCLWQGSALRQLLPGATRQSFPGCHMREGSRDHVPRQASPRPGEPGGGPIPAHAGWISVLLNRRLALEVHQLLEHLVRGRDDPGVGLKASLGRDHARELLCQVDVGHL